MSLAPGLFEQHGTYLNTATYGLPPKPAFEAMAVALADWRTGRTGEDEWEACTERARATFARLVGASERDVCVGATASELFGLVAASLPDGARVLVPERDFSSTLFPFAVHAHRGVTVTAVPLDALVASVSSGYDLVVTSQVQAQSGAVVDLASLLTAARNAGCMVCVDGTQACGWLPTDASAIDFYVCHAYKWLLAPRGAAFMAIRPNRLRGIVPLHAGWYATDDPNNNLFDLPPRLSSFARRLDSSPAWFSWVGAAGALALLEAIGIPAIYDHNMRLARRFCRGLDIADPPSPIVYVDIDDAYAKLLAAGIRASVRGGRMRASFHLYNDEGDVDRALSALRS